MEYRNEIKYEIKQYDSIKLKERLDAFLTRDENSNGEYRIKNLYFDTINNDAYFDNMYGVNMRHKYRIRIYNDSYDKIFLERKERKYQLIRKKRTLITYKELYSIIDGDWSVFEKSKDKLVRTLYTEHLLNGLRPIVVLEYDRTSYVERNGNVRLTIDKNIRGTSNIEDFLKSDITLIPIVSENKHVFEVKYNEFLPTYIRKIIDYRLLKRQSFSKYVNTRKKLERGTLR